MAKVSVILLGVILFISQEQKSSSFSLDIGDIREIIALGREIAVDGLESVEWIQRDSINGSTLDFPFVKKMERRLMNQLSKVSGQVQDLEDRIKQQGSEIVDILIRDLPNTLQFQRTINDLRDYLERIDDLHDQYKVYNASSKWQEFTMIEFARKCVSLEYGSLSDLLKSIHRLIVPKYPPNPEKGIFMQVAKNSQEASAQICNEQSPQQLLYNLYCTLTLTEIKGYSMIKFSYDLLKLYKNGTFDEEREKTFKDYMSRTTESMRAVRIAMAFAPTELRKCDPHEHKEGTTYEELKQLFQGYIVNEVDLNPTSTCRENCGAYSLSKVYGCYDHKYCPEKKCNGKVVNCQFIDSDMWMCPSKNSNRRYEYIEYENGVQFGQKGSCKSQTKKVDSWWRYIFWHCSYCMCTCDDANSNSDRYFYLGNVNSDVMNNKVVTGLRFQKVNRIIHIQIQEGKLEPRGVINNSSVNWKPVNNITMSDRIVAGSSLIHTLSWERRAIDLDDLKARDTEHLVTGVRFRVVGAHLNFEIRITPFNFTSGELIRPLEKSTWISNDNTDVHNFDTTERRTELILTNPDIPTKNKAPNFPDSVSNQYLNFGTTDLKKDAGQTTIPFIDVQSVVTNPPFPIYGAGVYHKGRQGSGGFVALKLFTYDFTDHIRVELPPHDSIADLNEISVS